MTRFRVLPIRHGDAYLLTGSRGSYVIDGGAIGCDLTELLTERKVRKLRAAICTSACPDRLGGVFELLESGFPVAEYWLPEGLELLPEMARRFNGDWAGWMRCVMGAECEADHNQGDWSGVVEILPVDDPARRLEGVAILVGLGMTICLGSSPYQGVSRDSFLYGDSPIPLVGLAKFFNWTLELLTDRAAARWRNGSVPMNRILRRFGWRLAFGGGVEELALLCGRLLLAEAEMMSAKSAAGARAILRGIALAATTSALLVKAPTRVRFFRYTSRFEEVFVPRHPFKCLNGVEVSPLLGLGLKSTLASIAHEARLIGAGGEGLVFQYGEADCSVLLCSDTRMSFMNKGESILLDRPTVVAAPRQGRSSSDRAYAFIQSRDISNDVWVRTHYSNAHKVSTYFKQQLNTLCLNNCTTHATQEILLEFSGSHWKCESGGYCSCP